jgi:hypothetical protein
LQAQPPPWLSEVSFNPSRISFSPAMSISFSFVCAENTAYRAMSQIAKNDENGNDA